MATLGEAVLELKTDSTALVKGMRDAKRGTDDLARQFQRVGRSMQQVGSSLTRSLTLPLAAVGAAFAAATVEAGNYADKILDLEQITGLSTESLQELEHVATVAGVSFEGLTGTIQRFSARLPQIEAGTSESAIAFDKLGVALRDSQGNVRDMEELFPELIMSLQNVENVTERNAIAQQVFGRSLNDLAPILGMTADQFEAARSEAHELGLVLDGDALNAANDYRVEIESLGAQLKTLWRNFAVDLIPVIKDTVLPAFRSLMASVRSALEGFGNLDSGLQRTILIVAATAAAIGPAVGLAGKIMSAAGAIRGLGVAFGLSNPMLAAFLVTLTAIVAGVGFLIHRARTAAKERELLTNAITGNVESMDEYSDALALLDKREEAAQSNIENYQRGLRAAQDELDRLREAEQRARSEGYGEDLLANNLRAQRELVGQIRTYEGEITRIRSEAQEERASVEQNMADLEATLRAEQEARESEEIAAIQARSQALQASIDAQLEGTDEVAEKEEEASKNALDMMRQMLSGVRDLDGELSDLDRAIVSDAFAQWAPSLRDATEEASGLTEELVKATKSLDRFESMKDKAPPEPVGYDGSGRPTATPEGAGSFGLPPGMTEGGGGDAAAGAAGAAMIAVAMAALQAMSSIEGFSEAIDPLGTIMMHMADAITPVVTSLLPVVLGLYERLGTILGEMLVPIFEALGPILEIIADLVMSILIPIMSMFATQFQMIAMVLELITPLLNALAFAIKVVMTPIAVLAGIFNWLGAIIGNLGRFIKNVVDKPFRPGTWGSGMESTDLSGHIRDAVAGVWTDQDLPGVAPTETPDPDAPGVSAGGSSATYRQARPITINQDISDNFFLGGDRSMRDFALMMKEEFELLGVLNA